MLVCLSACLLQYKEAPVLSVARRNVLVNNGDSAVLECQAQGIPTPNITWHRDGVQVHILQYTSLSCLLTPAKCLVSSVRFNNSLLMQFNPLHSSKIR